MMHMYTLCACVCVCVCVSSPCRDEVRAGRLKDKGGNRETEELEKLFSSRR